MSYFIVFVGGGIGAAIRHGVNRAVLALWGGGFPVGTIFVNVAGSYMTGVLAAVFLLKGIEDHPTRLFLTTGVLGGFTTFSAFSLDAADMWQRADWISLTSYVLGSVVGSCVALLLGIATVKVLA